MTDKPSAWSEEARAMISERKFEIRTDGANTQNVTFMEEAVKYEKMIIFEIEIRLCKKLNLLVELVGEIGRFSIDSFDKKIVNTN